MRIVTGPRSRWAITPGKAVRLPRWTVTTDGRIRAPFSHLLNSLVSGQHTKTPAYHLTVLTTTACNLGCSYCFQNVAPSEEGKFKPLRIASRTLTSSLAQDIGEFTRKQVADGGYLGLDLLVFGGEPLLNPRAVYALLEELNPMEPFTASMVSNAVRLDVRTAQRLVGLGLAEVQVTFDGVAADHDRVRIDHRGRPTYERIVANLADAIEHTELRFNLRVNVTRANAAGVHDLIADLRQRIDPRRCRMHFAVVDATQAGFDATAEVDVLDHEFLPWHLAAVEAGFAVDPPVAAKGCRYCDTMGGRDGAVIGADGKLYSCWDSAGQAGYDVGTVADGYLPEESMAERWVSCGYQAGAQAAGPSTALLDRTAVAVLDARSKRGGAWRAS